jgi:amino acid permease
MKLVKIALKECEKLEKKYNQYLKNFKGKDINKLIDVDVENEKLLNNFLEKYINLLIQIAPYQAYNVFNKKISESILSDFSFDDDEYEEYEPDDLGNE